MAPFTKIQKGLPCQTCAIHAHGLDHNLGTLEEYIALTSCRGTDLAFYHYRKLNKIGDTDPYRK